MNPSSNGSGAAPSPPRFWGTLEYVAPEVVQQGAAGYSPASDWWALGVLTFELLYKKSPFKVGGR